MFKDEIYKRLSKIIHPEFDKNIVELDLIELYKENAEKITITIKLPKANDPFSKALKMLIEISVNEVTEGKRKLSLDFKNPSLTKNESGIIEGVKNIIAVASGKGGVGKSTVSANLSVALSKLGYKVALLDADIYGPSIPKMFGVEDYQPDMEINDSEEKMIPADKFGIRIMSIGFFFDPQKALIWRGPMATSAIKELITKTKWGEIDFLIIDLPPGTNDIHLTLVQSIAINAAVIVTTPQQVAVADAVKAIDMFKNDKINIPIAGIIENMSWFTPNELPDKKYYILGKDGGKNLAESSNLKLLGQIPLLEHISSSGDSGNPAVTSENIAYNEAFKKLSEKFEQEYNEIKAKHIAKKVIIN